MLGGQRSASFAGSVSSLLGLLLFVVGVPLLLVAERAGLPVGLLTRALAHPSFVAHSLDRPVTDSTVIDSVVLAAWLAWAWLAICLFTEVVARLRGRPAARLPASRHVQTLAALLVGASMAVFPFATSYPPMRLAGAQSGSTVQVVSFLDAPGPAAAAGKENATRGIRPVALGGSRSESTRSGPTRVSTAVVQVDREYQVQPGDTLWSIARQELGSPLRWREIAAMNAGRQQRDGMALVDAGWILPGWILVLPGVPALTPANSDTVGNVVAAATHPTDGGSRPIDGASQDASHDTALPTLHGVAPASTTAVGPSGAHGSAERVKSGNSERPRSSTAGTGDSSTHEDPGTVDESPTATDSLRIGADRVAADGVDRAPSTPARDPSGIPFAPFGYGLLGAGVVILINRLRRAQQRHRPTGLRIALPDRELAEAERELRSSADPEAAEWVDAALRTLAAACRTHERAAPRVVAVRVLEHGTELVLGSPAGSEPAMEPFEDHDARSSWFLPRRDELLEEARSDPWIAGMDVISPGLVTLGRDTQGLLLFDVEQAGSVELTGHESDDVLRAMAIELATSSWSEQVNVVVVGVDRSSNGANSSDPKLDVLDRVRVVGSLVEVFPELRHLTTERSIMLNAVGLDKSSEARLAVSGDGWDLTVVFCTSHAVSANPKAVADLVALAAEGDRGLAVVCAGETVGAKWQLEVGRGPTSFRLSGVSGPELMLWPQTVDSEAEGQIAKLVEVAKQLEGVDPSTPPYDSLRTRPYSSDAETSSDRGPGSDSERATDIDRVIGIDSLAQPPAIEILVLGPVQVIGAARPFTRAWSLELVVYLAMHPGGATSDQWATHLWPSRSMAQASLHSTASAARRALGSTATGEDHLPRSHGRLALGPGVATDWDHFTRLSNSGDPSAWKQALELVRGRPFDGLRSTDWAVFSHVQANIESVVVDVSVRRCEHCLESVDPAGAEWAARQGLLVSPYDERLYRILMRAAYQAGNLAGVDSAMAELLQLVGGEVEPYDSVHPETYDLYRSLSRRDLPARLR
jgi:DNA-binding SARP family transcriptional activator